MIQSGLVRHLVYRRIKPELNSRVYTSEQQLATNSYGSCAMKTWFCVFSLLISFCWGAFAQQHPFSATSTCGISQHQTVAPDDEGQHSISLDQRVCTWQKPITLAGLSFADYTTYGTDDVQFDHSVDRGYAVGRNAEGDKYYLKYEAFQS
jgi:hypothetical protein